MRRVAPLAGLALGLFFGLARPAAAEPERRWPLWPTEIDYAAAALRDDAATESQRQSALDALDAYATPLVEPYILTALRDDSPQLRRDALQACDRRRLKSCVDDARRLWLAPQSELSNRLYALRVLLLDPTAAHVDLLLAALREPAELLRIEAARLLGITALGPEEARRVRAALVAKLADPAPEVRRAVARALGLLSASEATLVLARMLEDPDPQVRRDAAESLGMIGDPRALPAILRALDRGDEAYVARTLLEGLSLQRGEEVDRRLLAYLDAAPRGVTSKHVAEAIGARERPSAALLDGLVLRLREASIRDEVLSTLLHLGDAAVPAIEAALDRGVEPEVAIELERLLRARRLPEEPPPTGERTPGAEDRRGWHRRLDRDRGDRLSAAAELGELAPPWLVPAIDRALAAGDDAVAERPWLVALATARAPVQGDRRMWANVVTRAEDRRRSAGDRCLAVAALGRMPQRFAADFGAPLMTLAGAAKASVRGCVALALSGADAAGAVTLVGLLDDPSPRVRASAALALGRLRKKVRLPIAARLRLRELEDRDGRVRTAARHSGEPVRVDGPGRARLLLAEEPATPGWIAAEGARGPLLLPSQRFGRTAWALVPDDSLRARGDEPVHDDDAESDEWLE
ncbi:MAG: HEAT repeat domain-containing protein [Nannocystaceae bacterium]